MLLIVPVGIEIQYPLPLKMLSFRLLIVPVGIEICFFDILLKIANTFNRTSRNWNFDRIEPQSFGRSLLIVPVGIEISYFEDYKGGTVSF